MSGELSYTVVENWEQLPEGFKHLDCVGAGIDANDRVYVITRLDPRVIVYEADGTFVTAWGEGIFTPRTHCIKFGPDGSVYTADDGNHTIRKFSPDGKLLMTLGTPGVASDTGYVKEKGLSSITHGGPPFNRPTGVALAPNGDIFVCDGYGNARVHHFTAKGELLQSWGEPGTGPGQFNLPHDIWVMPDGRIMVADRENDRIQFFSPTGEFLDQWTHVHRPTGLAMDKDGSIYVTELWWIKGQKSQVHGPITEDQPGRVSIFASDGKVLARFGDTPVLEEKTAPGNLIAPHGVGVDSHGDIYVAEVTEAFGVKRGGVPSGSHSFQKFARK